MAFNFCCFSPKESQSAINPAAPKAHLSLFFFLIILIYPLLCRSPSEALTHSFEVQRRRAPPSALSPNSLTFVTGNNMLGEGARGHMAALCHSGWVVVVVVGWRVLGAQHRKKQGDVVGCVLKAKV